MAEHITYRVRLQIVEMPQHHYGPRFHVLETRAIVGSKAVIQSIVGHRVWHRAEAETILEQAGETV